MSDFYEKLKTYKESNGLTFNELGKIISVSGDTFRMAMNRQTFSELRKKKILSAINNEQNEQSSSHLHYWKGGVKISLDEMISFFTTNIKSIKETGKLDVLIQAINTVENIDQYNRLNDEIEKIKDLLARNKELLK